MLPLFKGAEEAALQAFGKGTANLGLWFDKFCHIWPERLEPEYWPDGKRKHTDFKLIEKTRINGKDVFPKRNWLNALCEKPTGNAALLKEHARRRETLVDAQGGMIQTFESHGRFVTGMGRGHPLENGFTFHHALGMPYLPGSSVKGLIRAWAESWENESKELTLRIFGHERPERGDDKAGKEDRAGAVIFLDALPAEPVILGPDVMTPHYGPYYQPSPGNNPIPGDWYSPVPVQYLTMVKGSFDFCLLPGLGCQKDDLKTVMGWLEKALSFLGAGGKTAQGHGRFEPIAKDKASQAKAAVDPYQAYETWFDAQDFGNPRKRGLHGQIKDHIERRLKDKPEAQARAKAYARQKLTSKGCSGKMWEYLNG